MQFVRDNVFTILTLCQEYSLSICFAASDYVEQFVCDGLLATFIVFESKFRNQICGIVGSDLHCKHAGGMFGCYRIKERCEEPYLNNLWNKCRQKFIARGFDDKTGYR